MPKLTKIALGACLLVLGLRPAYGDKHDKWVEARSQNFVVVTNAGEKQALKTDQRFEQIRALFREYLPVAKEHPSQVITIIAVKDENSMRDLLPEFWAKGHMHPAGVFFRGFDQQQIIVQVDAGGTNPYAPIFHEYYHSLTMPYFPGLSVWLAEGLADFFGYSHVEGQKAYMGEPAPGLIWELRQRPLIPLDVLFNVNRASPYYNEADKTNIFYAESWALTHYLWMADKGSHKAMLMAYLTAASQPGATEEQAAKAFGDLKKLQSVLQSYVSSDEFFRLEAAAPPVPETDTKVRDLSDAEADAYLGGFEALRGKPQDAKPLLEEAIKLDPKVALAYQNLGVTQFFQGDRSAALESFSKAISLDPKNALSHYFRAYLSIGQERDSGDDAQFDDDLRQSIALDPGFAPAFLLLANHLADSSDNLSEALKVAKQAVTIEPGNSGALLALAHVLVRMRNFNDAQTVAQWAERDALNGQQRQSAEQVLNYVQQVRSAGAEGRQPLTANPAAAGRSADSADDDETGARSSGGQQHAVGVITQSGCVNGGPQIELKTESGVVVLHGTPGQSLSISLSFKPPEGFNACKSLKGYRASASYTLDEAGGTHGTITALRLLSPTPEAEDPAK
jgi:tetratricopeptide (TPR) repeat protein